LPPDKRPLYSVDGGIFSFSGSALKEIIHAVFSKNLPFRFRAKGTSMAPFIQDGAIITIHPITKNKIPTGEIIAFRHPLSDKLVVHRMIRRYHGFIIAKGDNNSQDDGDIPEKNIFGIVTKVENKERDIYLGSRFMKWFLALLSRYQLLNKKIFDILQRCNNYRRKLSL
jgi:signal peptidase I